MTQRCKGVDLRTGLRKCCGHRGCQWRPVVVCERLEQQHVMLLSLLWLQLSRQLTFMCGTLPVAGRCRCFLTFAAFTARVLGMTSSASANSAIASCSLLPRLVAKFSR